MIFVEVIERFMEALTFEDCVNESSIGVFEGYLHNIRKLFQVRKVLGPPSCLRYLSSSVCIVSQREPVRSAVLETYFKW